MTPPPLYWLVAVEKTAQQDSVWNSDDHPLPGQSFDCLAMNLTRAVQYRGRGGMGIPTQQGVPSTMKACLPIPKFLIPPLKETLIPPLTKYILVVYAQYPIICSIFMEIGSDWQFKWISEQYDILHCVEA